MAVPEGKDRIIITVSNELKAKLIELAEEDNRNLSNYCANLLEKIVKEKE
jgi:hypothetical protein